MLIYLWVSKKPYTFATVNKKQRFELQKKTT